MGGGAGAGKGSEATGARPGRSAPLLGGGPRRGRVGVGASEALVGALGVGGEVSVRVPMPVPVEGEGARGRWDDLPSLKAIRVETKAVWTCTKRD